MELSRRMFFAALPIPFLVAKLAPHPLMFDGTNVVENPNPGRSFKDDHVMDVPSCYSPSDSFSLTKPQVFERDETYYRGIQHQ